MIFLFTGESGTTYGYSDGWDTDGVFRYTGEGQVGDMQFVRGNRATRDHAKDGKDLLLFETLGKGKGCRFLGAFVCSSYEFRDGKDRDGKARRVIVFYLVPTDYHSPGAASELRASNRGSSLEELRRRAYEAVITTGGSGGKQAQRTIYERSSAVRDYVLARANGQCESCGMPAPFTTTVGAPYLEPHHIRRLSDGGPDDPRWVGAVCPNCHRHIHYGRDGLARNKQLANKVIAREAQILKVQHKVGSAS